MGRFRTHCLILIAAAMFLAVSFGASSSQAAPSSPIVTVKIQLLSPVKMKVTVVANRTTPRRLRLFLRVDSDADAIRPSQVTPKGYEGKMDDFDNYILRMPSLRPGQRFVVVASYPAAKFNPNSRFFTAGVLHKTTTKNVTVSILK